MPKAVPLIDNPLAPDIFATGASGYYNTGTGNIVVTLESARPDHTAGSKQVSRMVIGRLVLPASAARMLAIELNTFLEQQGLGPSAVLSHKTKQ